MYTMHYIDKVFVLLLKVFSSFNIFELVQRSSKLQGNTVIQIYIYAYI